MSGFISTAVTRGLPEPNATSTSEPPPGPITSVSGRGVKLNGRARNQVLKCSTLFTSPSQRCRFVQASESM